MTPPNRIVHAAEECAKLAASVPPIRGARITACVLNGKQRIYGYNARITHPKQAKYAYNDEAIYLHAEIYALIKAKWECPELVVVRVRKDGTWGCAKPCAGCEQALDPFIPYVWYSTGNGKELAYME